MLHVEMVAHAEHRGVLVIVVEPDAHEPPNVAIARAVMMARTLGDRAAAGAGAGTGTRARGGGNPVCDVASLDAACAASRTFVWGSGLGCTYSALTNPTSSSLAR
jgi:hypothetical protein